MSHRSPIYSRFTDSSERHSGEHCRDGNLRYPSFILNEFSYDECQQSRPFLHCPMQDRILRLLPDPPNELDPFTRNHASVHHYFSSHVRSSCVLCQSDTIKQGSAVFQSSELKLPIVSFSRTCRPRSEHGTEAAVSSNGFSWRLWLAFTINIWLAVSRTD